MGMEANIIYHENNLKTMARMPDNFIDLTVTSPPYDNQRNYNGYSFDFESIAKELLRVTKPGGVVVWVVNDQVVNGSESGTSFRQALYFKEIGFNLHDTMIYKSEGLTMNHNRYEQEFEYMFILSNGKPKTFNSIRIPCKYHLLDGSREGQKTGEHSEKNKKLRSAVPRTTVKRDKIKGNIWKYSTRYNKSTDYKDAFKHPAIFPEMLAIDHIISWSNKGDLVYDPFMGSGTTAVAAIKHERQYIGSEISKEYCDISNERIRQELSQQRLPLTN